MPAPRSDRHAPPGYRFTVTSDPKTAKLQLLTTYTQTHNNPTGPHTLNTLQPPPAFCTNPAIAQNRDYRWDGAHYYKPGSALYFQSAIPQLLALPR